MHQYPHNQSYVGSTNMHNKCVHDYVVGKFVPKPMSYVAARHLVPNQIGPQISAVPTPIVAWTTP